MHSPTLEVGYSFLHLLILEVIHSPALVVMHALWRDDVSACADDFSERLRRLRDFLGRRFFAGLFAPQGFLPVGTFRGGKICGMDDSGRKGTKYSERKHRPFVLFYTILWNIHSRSELNNILTTRKMILQHELSIYRLFSYILCREATIILLK